MIHHVYANRSNAGDWLSAQGIQSLLHPHPVQEHFCDGPFVADTIRGLSAAGPEDFIIIGGGGLFMDYFVPFWRDFLPIGARVPFAIWGAGFCDHKQQSSLPPADLLEQVVRLSKVCAVRDELTLGRLRHLAHVRQANCPATIALPPSPRPPQGCLLHVDHFNDIGAGVYEKMDAAGRLFAEATQRRFHHLNNRLPNGDRAALGKIVESYHQADVVLSSRLHGCIMALSVGRPVLAVSGDRKIESFMQQAGLADWVLDRENIDALPDRLRDLPAQALPADFVARTWRDNRAVAADVLTFINPI